MPSHDLDAIKREHSIDSVIGRYIELKRDGSEYTALCPFHAENTPSFTVVPDKGFFHCFGCGANGDALDFVQEIESCNLPRAAEIITGVEAPNPVMRSVPAPADDVWQPVQPIPIEALGDGHMRPWNPKRDRVTRLRPAKTWAYRDAESRILGFVCRIDLPDGKKWTPQVTYCRHRDTGELRWCLVPMPKPRPLLGLPELAASPGAAVVVVEGEKARDAAQAGLPRMVVVTWPGGTQGARHADWSPLAGRDVTLWPDADGPGLDAMHEIANMIDQPKRLRWIDTEGLPDGFDAADVDGSITEHCRARVREYAPPEPDPDPAGPEPETEGVMCSGERSDRAGDSTAAVEPPAAAPDEPAAGYSGQGPGRATVVDLPARGSSDTYSSMVSWSQLGLALSDKGVPVANLDNASAILERHPAMFGRLWFDEFLGRVLSDWNGDSQPREWTDKDDVRLTLWIQRALGVRNMAVGTVRDAVTVVSMAHRRNECADWIESLEWDGVERLPDLFVLGFGAESSEYTRAIGRCFMVGMVARALRPGCKVDTMPILEGGQGKFKSTALQLLVGARWFAEPSDSPLHKDFFQSLQGKLLVEIAEMDTFSRTDRNAIKRVVSCQVDRYRASYGHRAEDHPRRGVFSGTTNENEYLQDTTGGRRFWPFACGDIDLEWIEANRTQLFAEAAARFRRGESWWDVPADEAREAQEARRVTDAWEPVIEKWLRGRHEVTVGDVMAGALNLQADAWDKLSQMRVASALKVLGWSRTLARREGKPVRVWVTDPKPGDQASIF